ncbi:MAG: hypothetical protein JXA73_07340 [Acidobacteria bacterium]|nr:hypothetical protein [Acidobacteriota bacterium]
MDSMACSQRLAVLQESIKDKDSIIIKVIPELLRTAPECAVSTSHWVGFMDSQRSRTTAIANLIIHMLDASNDLDIILPTIYVGLVILRVTDSASCYPDHLFSRHTKRTFHQH